MASRRMPACLLLPLLFIPVLGRPADVNITTVHVVSSCHLDIGFKALSASVINEYFTRHIPLAIQIAGELRNDTLLPKGYRLKFMAQSWYIWLYFNCPPNLGITCPSEQEQGALRDAISRGDVTYHAFPHNAELSTGSPLIITEGLRLTHALDETFKVPPKTTLSQRDVPGMPRSVIPILRAQGVTAVSVGVNGASMYPNVPSIFTWVDPISGTNVTAMWHPKGYGGYDRASAVTVPGSKHALVTVWNGDNAGPMYKDEYVKVFKQIESEFPGAQAVGSTFDDFITAVTPQLNNLPVIENEIADSWIHGCASDPRKLSGIRALMRAWDNFSAPTSDPVYDNATMFLNTGIEHTWGLDVKTWLKDNTDWNNAAFHKADGSPLHSGFRELEASWDEQRKWAIGIPLQILKSAQHPLYESARRAWDATQAPEPNPDNEGFSMLDDPADTIQCGSVRVAFSAQTGGLSYLEMNGTIWVSPDSPSSGKPLSLTYQTYNLTDFQQFWDNYTWAHPPPSWFEKDFGKPNDTAAHTVGGGHLRHVWTRNHGCEVLTQVDMKDPAAHRDYGAPDRIWIRISIDNVTPSLQIAVHAIEKTATRHAEAMFLSFQFDSPAGSPMQYQLDKLGEWVTFNGSRTIVDGGSKHLHAVGWGVRALSGSVSSGSVSNNTIHTRGSEALGIRVMDSGIVNVGKPNGFPTPGNQTADVIGFGVSAMLWNNVWGTNYPQWIPYNRTDTAEANLLFRFQIAPTRA